MAVVSCVLLAGCGPNTSSDESQLTYWRTLSGAAGAAQDELVERFNESQTGWTAVSEFQGGYGDLAAKLMAASTADSGPDVTQLGTYEIRLFARAGMLVDLTPFLQGDDGLDTSDWPGTMLEAGRVDGGVYWLPFNVTVPVLYYNLEAFEEAGLDGPPETWTEFFDYCQRLSPRDASGRVRRAGLSLWSISWPILSAIWSEGGRLTTPDYSEITLDDPVAIQVLSAFQSLVRDGAASVPSEASGGHRGAFLNGKAAMILDSPAQYDALMAPVTSFTPRVALYPAGARGRVYAPGGGGIVMMSATPAEKRAGAWRFMKFMLMPEQIAYYAERSGYTAFTGASQSVAGAWLSDPQRALMHQALPYLRGDFSLNASPALRNAFDKGLQSILFDLTDVGQTLAKADAEAEANIAREIRTSSGRPL